VRVVLLLALALAADPRARLSELEARKAAERAAASALADQERSVLDTLEEVERAWRDAEARARAAEGERARSASRLERAEREEGEALARHRARMDRLRPRLAALQLMARVGELRLLASSPSLGDLVKRRVLLGKIVEGDSASLREAREALLEQERLTAARRSEAARLETLAAEAGTRRAEASSRRDGFRATLAAVRGERQLHERAASEAEAQSRKLAEFIEALAPSRPGSAPFTGFASLRGRLPRPAGGRIDVGFGKVVDPRFRTITVQKGVDLAAQRGEAVQAVAPGRVVHAGWFKGYGNLVIVDHGEVFHTLVAHLASMTAAAGEDVEAGAMLGTVGDTGSLKGAYLYFEIRERGKPLDPKAWLVP
jgi:septal ring factor EnvC (AmiA/AmiB activator)